MVVTLQEEMSAKDENVGEDQMQPTTKRQQQKQWQKQK